MSTPANNATPLPPKKQQATSGFIIGGLLLGMTAIGKSEHTHLGWFNDALTVATYVAGACILLSMLMFSRSRPGQAPAVEADAGDGTAEEI